MTNVLVENSESSKSRGLRQFLPAIYAYSLFHGASEFEERAQPLIYAVDHIAALEIPKHRNRWLHIGNPHDDHCRIGTCWADCTQWCRARGAVSCRPVAASRDRLLAIVKMCERHSDARTGSTVHAVTKREVAVRSQRYTSQFVHPLTPLGLAVYNPAVIIERGCSLIFMLLHLRLNRYASLCRLGIAHIMQSAPHRIKNERA